ncbi:hypothetical protein [Nesterenkonia natronophila]|uniref:Methionine synthase n=1 Tax=Nesterenkonia natronophila TaxID=2174932 RepID=A0A3A4F9D4_9MICC|nr:hypothetical protein [Nesterenkonia natronophila]RJN31807.1 hypothetical protein D3250_06705 [Nesterenkonia natronophila]
MTIRAAAPGTMPGHDFRRAAEQLEPELSAAHFASLPDLPARGHHGTQLGRGIAQLAELNAELTSFGWRLVQRPGADYHRCSGMLSSDVDTLADVRGAEAELGKELSPLHLEVLGPVSLAARLHLPNGEKVLIDHGARRDLTHALAMGLAEHVKHVRRSVRPESLCVLLQEPDHRAVRTGSVPTVSGYQSIRALGRDDARSMISTVVDALRNAGADQVIFDCGQIVEGEHIEDFFSRSSTAADGFVMPVPRASASDWERTAELVEAGAQVWAGLLRPGPHGGPQALPEVSALMKRLTGPWQRLGMPPSSLSSITVTGYGAADRHTFSEVAEADFLRTWSRLRETAEALTDQMQHWGESIR